MYWHVNYDTIFQGMCVVAYNLNPDVAGLIAENHNKIVRQVTQREIAGCGTTPQIALHNLAHYASTYDLNEIHLYLGDDGYWYANTTVDVSWYVSLQKKEAP